MKLVWVNTFRQTCLSKNFNSDKRHESDGIFKTYF